MINNLRYIWCAFLLAEFGRAMYFIIITWILYEMTNNALYTGLLISVGFVPSLIMNLIFGVIVDRFDRKILTVTANLICTITMSIILITVILNILSPWMIISTHVIIQLMGALFRPAIQAFIASLFSKNELPKVFSQSGSAAIIGGLLGASIGGAIIGFTSEFFAMGIVVTSFAMATVLLILVKQETGYSITSSKEKSIITDLIEGFHYFKRNTFLFNLFGVMFVGQLVFHSSIAFLSVYTKEYLEQTVTIYGFLDASLSTGGVVAGMFGTWWWNNNTNYISSRSLIVVFIGLILVGFAPILPIAILGVFLIGLGTTWIRVLLQSVQQMATDKQFHGRMSSYRMICNQGSVVIGAPILGGIANTYGANGIYIALLVPVFITAILALKQARLKELIEITKKTA